MNAKTTKILYLPENTPIIQGIYQYYRVKSGEYTVFYDSIWESNIIIYSENQFINWKNRIDITTLLRLHINLSFLVIKVFVLGVFIVKTRLSGNLAIAWRDSKCAPYVFRCQVRQKYVLLLTANAPIEQERTTNGCFELLRLVQN